MIYTILSDNLGVRDAYDIDKKFMSTGSSSSTSNSNTMSGDGSTGSDPVELPIWIGGCQKWITGLTRRTTCDDVIYALLAHEHNPNDVIDVTTFAIHERWRDVERPLRGRTKILKVWRAWGADRNSVRFSVRKVADNLDTSSEVSRIKKTRRPQHTKERERRSREKDRGRERKSSSRTEPHSNSRTDNRVSRVEYKLREPQTSKPVDVGKEDEFRAKAFHDLVQRVLSNEKLLQDQVTRLRETDAQIDNYETKMHMLRMKENGQNYVQEAYLKDSSESSSGGEELFPAIKANDLEAYGHMCDNILSIQDRITSEQSKIDELSMRIQEETMVEPPDCSDFFSESVTDTFLESADAPGMPEMIASEIAKLRAELERSASLSAAQQTQMQLVTDTLDECDYQLQRRRAHMHSLLAEIAEIDGDARTPVVTFETCERSTPDIPPPLPPPRVDKSDKSRKDSGIDDNFDYEPPRPGSKRRSSRRDPPPRIMQNSQRQPPTVREHLKSVRSMECLSNTNNHFNDMEYYVTKSYRDFSGNKQSPSDNDSTSDTGLSSLHSEDTPPILETLV